MTDTFRMTIYDRQKRLWDRIGGTEEELREQGVGFTTGHGQKAWTCNLDRNGVTVAVCRRGPGLRAGAGEGGLARVVSVSHTYAQRYRRAHPRDEGRDHMSNPATTPEPAPVRTDSPAVWPLVIRDLNSLDAPEWLRQVMAEDMRARDEFGREKYGTPLQVKNGRDAGTDAYQEALDLCVYARQMMEQTGLAFWSNLFCDALGLAAGIRYQLALKEAER